MRDAVEVAWDAVSDAPLIALFTVLLVAAGGVTGFLVAQVATAEGDGVTRITVREQQASALTVTKETTRTVEVSVFEQKVRALRAEGTAGSPIRLEWVAGTTGATRERIEIRRGGRVIDIIETRRARSEAGVRYWTNWRPAAARTGRLRFCIRLATAAGRGAGFSCAPLVVRRS